jgi:hypothetical protein
MTDEISQKSGCGQFAMFQKEFSHSAFSAGHYAIFHQNIFNNRELNNRNLEKLRFFGRFSQALRGKGEKQARAL